MSLRRPVLVVSTVLALALSGCSGGSSAEQDSPAPSADLDALVVEGEVDQEVLAALVEDLRALDGAEVEERIAEVSRDLELELYAVSGMTEELGGEGAAAASIAETAGWLEELGAEVVVGGPAPRVAPFGVASRSARGTSFGEGLFGGMVIGSLLSDLSASTLTGGRGEAGSTEGNGVAVTSTGTEATVTSSHQHTDSTGVTTDLSTRSVLAGCPDADGTFRASTRVQVGSTTSGGRTGKRASMTVEVIGTVGESAQLLGYDTVYQGEMADFRDSRGGYAEFTGSIPREGASSGAISRTGGAYTDELGRNALGFGMTAVFMFSGQLVEAARKVWESGVCVILEPTVSAGPKGLSPGGSVEVVADPRARKDGRPTGGVVTAVLSAGAASVAPGEAPARATFTYTAPPERDATGTVALTSRSRRGIGKAEIAFDTEQSSYVASGGGEVAFSGTVPSVTEPFSIRGTFPGGATTFAFDAATPTGGTVEVSGGGSGASLTGSGTYTLSERGGGVLLLTAKVRSCVDVSRICRRTTHPITLTPER